MSTNGRTATDFSGMAGIAGVGARARVATDRSAGVRFGSKNLSATK
jgi:hypothetical protein